MLSYTPTVCTKQSEDSMNDIVLCARCEAGVSASRHFLALCISLYICALQMFKVHTSMQIRLRVDACMQTHELLFEKYMLSNTARVSIDECFSKFM